MPWIAQGGRSGLVRRFIASLSRFLATVFSLRTLDAVVPKDAGGRRVASSLAFGPGPRRRLDLYAPLPAKPYPLPIIIFFYGGSWNSGDRRDYAFVGRALASHGFLVVIPDYRLVPEVRFPSFVEDGAAALRWIRRHAHDHGGDSGRVVVMGHSAGAYIAAMLAVDRRWLGRDHAALKGLIGLAGPYDFAPFDVDVSRAAFGAWPEAPETQPVHHVDADAPPSLLLTGDRDHTVGPHNSASLADRLHRAGVPVEWRTYGGVGHVGILLAIAWPFRRRATVLADVAAFAVGVTSLRHHGVSEVVPLRAARSWTDLFSSSRLF